MSRSFFPTRTRNSGEVTIRGRFKPNGSSAITNTRNSTIYGNGFSVARTNTGLFTLTLNGKFGTFLGGSAQLHTSTVADGNALTVRIPTVSGDTTSVVLAFYGEDAGGLMQLEDIASAADNWISFELHFLTAQEAR